MKPIHSLTTFINIPSGLSLQPPTKSFFHEDFNLGIHLLNEQQYNSYVNSQNRHSILFQFSFTDVIKKLTESIHSMDWWFVKEDIDVLPSFYHNQIQEILANEVFQTIETDVFLHNFKLVDIMQFNDKARDYFLNEMKKIQLAFEPTDIYLKMYDDTTLGTWLYSTFSKQFRLRVMVMNQMCANFINKFISIKYIAPHIKNILDSIENCDSKNCTNLCMQYITYLDSKFIELGVISLRHKRHSPSTNLYHSKAALPEGYTIVEFYHPFLNRDDPSQFFIPITSTCEDDDLLCIAIKYKNCIVALDSQMYLGSEV